MTSKNGLVRMETGIVGLDELAGGGFPRGRTTLIQGAMGTGKTVLGVQCVYSGVTTFDEGGVLVTFDESPNELVQNVESFGWDIPTLVKRGRLAVVDATSNPEEETVHSGPYDLSALIVRIEHAIQNVNAKRVVIDALDAVFVSLPDRSVVVREMRRLGARLKKGSVTTFVTARRGSSDLFAADNVVVLRTRPSANERRRTIEIVKMRGASHRSGEHPLRIAAECGIVVGTDNESHA